LLGCLEVDDELKLCRLLHGQVGRLDSLQDLIDTDGGALEALGVVS
jgi:hypothetical protein